MSDFVKIHADDTAIIVRDGMTLRTAKNAATIESLEGSGRMSNTAATAVIIPAADLYGYVWIGETPFYSKTSPAGPVRVQPDLFSQVV